MSHGSFSSELTASATKLFLENEPTPVAVLNCGTSEQWHLHVEDRALHILDTIAVTGIVMLKKRRDRNCGHARWRSVG